ncbi:helix-turn-helix domain-containing protein [Azospirillum thermophilum]|nr:helix-turn-helix transcriptional regulator [Azospirillum thermophilum]
MAIRSNTPGRPYLLVGQRIEALRLYAGLTVTEMAEVMGTSQSRYTTIQYGRALPDAEKLEPLCVRWGLSLDWIYRGDRRLMPVGIMDELDVKLQTLVDEEGRPHQRRPGRPAGTSRKRAPREED